MVTAGATMMNQSGMAGADNCSTVAANTSAPWKSGESLISQDADKVLYIAHTAVAIPLLFMIGAPFNVLNMLVFVKQGLKDRITMCLFSLATLDLLYVFLVFVFNAGRAYWRLKEDDWVDAAFRFTINSGLLGLYGISYGPYLISAVIAAERCVCVLFPLQARHCVSTRALALAIVAGVLALVSLRLVVLARLKVVCLSLEGSGDVEWAVSKSDFYFRNRRLVDSLDRVFFGYVVVIGCTLVVLISTVVTAVRLQHIVRWRAQSSSALSSKEIVVIKMIMCLSVQFAVLSAPKIVLRFSRVIDPQLSLSGVYRNLYTALVCLGELCSYTSSVVNFFVYYVYSSRYRETLRALLAVKAPPKECSSSPTPKACRS